MLQGIHFLQLLLLFSWPDFSKNQTQVITIMQLIPFNPHATLPVVDFEHPVLPLCICFNVVDGFQKFTETEFLKDKAQSIIFRIYSNEHFVSVFTRYVFSRIIKLFDLIINSECYSLFVYIQNCCRFAFDVSADGSIFSAFYIQNKYD